MVSIHSNLKTLRVSQNHHLEWLSSLEWELTSRSLFLSPLAVQAAVLNASVLTESCVEV
jgi:hypothetical protein